MNAKPIAFRDGALQIIDQTKLPGKVEVIELRRWQDVVDAIQTMKIRGAPAIGIAGAYALVLAAFESSIAAQEHFLTELETAAAAIASARPTAVNLAWAVRELMEKAKRMSEAGDSPAAVASALLERARAVHDDDLEACRRIGDFGGQLIPLGASVLTHCNTGDFATGGYGTALGVVRSAWRDARLRRVFVTETRPLLQGARLTAWELRQDQIPYVLIADSMAGHFMQRGDVGAVVVGADRIARNGDVANKIGTYGLAVLAKAHGIPFIVAAPRSSFDRQLADGTQITIEERDRREMIQLGGVPTAPADATAANPAFDVTPSRYVSAIVTEFGVLSPPFETAIAGMLAREPARTPAR